MNHNCSAPPNACPAWTIHRFPKHALSAPSSTIPATLFPFIPLLLQNPSWRSKALYDTMFCVILCLLAGESVTEQILYEVFSRAGTIQSVRLCRESNSRKSLGYGYINYQTPQDGETPRL